MFREPILPRRPGMSAVLAQNCEPPEKLRDFSKLPPYRWAVWSRFYPLSSPCCRTVFAAAHHASLSSSPCDTCRCSKARNVMLPISYRRKACAEGKLAFYGSVKRKPPIACLSTTPYARTNQGIGRNQFATYQGASLSEGGGHWYRPKYSKLSQLRQLSS